MSIRESRVWPGLWLSGFAALQAGVLSIFYFALPGHGDWFAITAIIVSACCLALAYQASDTKITRKWWIGLIGLQAVIFGMFTYQALALDGAGEGRHCPVSYVYRYRQVIPVAPPDGCFLPDSTVVADDD